MWKKDDVTEPTTPSLPPERENLRPRRDQPGKGAPDQAVIGRSISVRGDVSGKEDLLIQGDVEGSIELQEQVVTVGEEGQVKADITGRVVTVEGRVEGNLLALEQVILRSSARVRGDIKAPRVVLEDGAAFRGMVDMGEPAGGQKHSGPGASSASASAPQGTGTSGSTPLDRPSDPGATSEKPPEGSPSKGSDSTGARPGSGKAGGSDPAKKITT